MFFINTLVNYANIILNGGSVGKNVKIRGLLRVRGNVELNDNVIINSKYRMNPIGGMTFTSFYAARKAKIVVGKNTGMSNCALFAKKCIFIGENCKIGGDVKIYDSDFHSLNWDKRRKSETDSPIIREVVIGDDVFIGAGSVILKGVHIGNKSIVGAGSVVTKDIPDCEIWAGNPAKFIKRTINDCDKI